MLILSMKWYGVILRIYCQAGKAKCKVEFIKLLLIGKEEYIESQLQMYFLFSAKGITQEDKAETNTIAHVQKMD